MFSLDYLNQSPRLDSASSPLSTTGFERAPTPGLKTHPATPEHTSNPAPPPQHQFNLQEESPLSSPPPEPAPPPPQQQQPKPANSKKKKITTKQQQNEKAKPTENQPNPLSNLNFKRKKDNKPKRNNPSTKTSSSKPAQKKVKVSEHSQEDQPQPTKSSPNLYEPPPQKYDPPPTTTTTNNLEQENYAPPSSSSKTNTKKNAPIKKPIKPSFKKTTTTTKSTPKPITNSTPNNVTPSHLLNQQNPTNQQNPNKNKEFDLNNPHTWGALFGGCDKKPAAKPVKLGNLPPQAALSYNANSVDRLGARKKQRSEEKRTLLDHSKYGFDLLRQHSVMMDFEIEYKNHVRAMVERPIEASEMEATQAAESSSAGGISRGGSMDVLCRSDGYKRYLNPHHPQPDHLPLPHHHHHQPPPPPVLGFHSQQPPGPTYSSTHFNSLNPASATTKILPRPGMFGSSFFIWQAHHLS